MESREQRERRNADARMPASPPPAWRSGVPRVRACAPSSHVSDPGMRLGLVMLSLTALGLGNALSCIGLR